ncbi:inhibitor of nuclear factor kappa-B kinase-interacting protein isoform X1 [Ctenopharyngodon idella]|uniref:inhibitor of nuclear factor kappa-B kinase-interacting protein isoform X1 n=1 Tax=Ctenopharyngodon idella TaxID=7959 RepID=UPI002231255B|nr:inhibitor of nuclear factor kappa-B kinase-interacting protein isoform X1 [Ctenopharyngodon idella]
MCLALSLSITWLHLQQGAKLAEMTEKYEFLQEKSRSVQDLDEKLTEVSQKCASVHALMSGLAGTPVVSQMEALSAEVNELKARFSSLTGQRQQLQQDLSTLAEAVEDVESRTLQVSNDVTSKVASIRTDVRRMAGLETEVEALLNQTNALEEKVVQTEKLMVKRIGDLLAGSIDRVSGLKSSTERNGQRLDQISSLVHQLSTDNRKLAEQILALESGQAKLRKMVTFADDLKPKVFTIRQDFAIVEPKLADLTLRIGQLAEDMMSREGEVAELRERFSNRDSSQTVRDEMTHDTLDQLTP